MTSQNARRLSAIFLAGLGLMLSACGQDKVLYVDQAWVRLSANKDMPSAGYFTVHGGEEDVRLLSVISPTVIRIDMHESKEQNGVMTMDPVGGIDIPARAEVVFAPGGKHLMIWGINQAVKSQGKLPLTFIFSNGDRIIYDAVLRQPGASEGPAAPGHEYKGHAEPSADGKN